MRTRLAMFLITLAACPAVSLAQGVSTSPGAWIDVSVGTAASAASPTTFVFPFTLFLEPASIRATYPTPSRAGLFDAGGGYMFTPRVGVGLSIGAATSEDVADLAVSIPHPLFFNAFGQASSPTTRALARRELATNLHAMIAAVNANRMQVRLFGGPSFISYRADMVQDVHISQDAGFMPAQNTVTIQGEHIERASGRTLGLHVGADVAYFFTRAVGVGGGLRVSRGTVTLDPEPLSEVAQEVRVGGTQIVGGVRFRFGAR